MLADAKAERRRQEQRSRRLENTQEENERSIGQMQEQYDKRLGNLRETVRRPAAGGRRHARQVQRLADQRPISESRRLAGGHWLPRWVNPPSSPPSTRWSSSGTSLQREMTESGRVTRFQGNVNMLDGDQVETDLVRVGSFVIVGEDGYVKLRLGTANLG